MRGAPRRATVRLEIKSKENKVAYYNVIFPRFKHFAKMEQIYGSFHCVKNVRI